MPRPVKYTRKRHHGIRAILRIISRRLPAGRLENADIRFSICQPLPSLDRSSHRSYAVEAIVAIENILSPGK